MPGTGFSQHLALPGKTLRRIYGRFQEKQCRLDLRMCQLYLERTLSSNKNDGEGFLNETELQDIERKNPQLAELVRAMSVSELQTIREKCPQLLEHIKQGERTTNAWLKSKLKDIRSEQEDTQKKEALSPNEQPSQGQNSGENNVNAGPETQLNADLQLALFKNANSKLAKYKSQLPNLSVQARIFEPVTPGRRKFYNQFQKVPVIGRDDIAVEMQGIQLDQSDLTGWLMMIKFAGPDLVTAFTRYEFLKAMHKDTGGKGYEWLVGKYNPKTEKRKLGFLDRIASTKFKITLFAEDKSWVRYTGSLALHGYETSEEKFVYELSKPLSAMFGVDGWSFINLEQRLKLGQQQWAQAFHAWASTNICPNTGFWWNKEELKEQWGPEYTSSKFFLENFKRRVIRPLHEISFIEKVIEKKASIGIWWSR